MIVKGGNLSEDVVNKLKSKYRYLRVLDNGIEIKGEKLMFDEIVDSLRLNGVTIEWLTMKEASLDDVFLSLNKEK